MKRKMFLAVLLAAAVFTAGCPKSPYRAALNASDDIGAGVHNSVDVYKSLYQSNMIDDAEKAKAVQALTVVNDANLAFKACIDSAHLAAASAQGQAPYLACATALAAKVSSFDPVAIGVKNPAAQKKLQNYLQAIKTAIDGVTLAIQSAKGH